MKSVRPAVRSRSHLSLPAVVNQPWRVWDWLQGFGMRNAVVRDGYNPYDPCFVTSQAVRMVRWWGEG